MNMYKGGTLMSRYTVMHTKPHKYKRGDKLNCHISTSVNFVVYITLAV